MKIYFDHQETTKGDLERALEKGERQARDIRILEERMGVTASDETYIKFLTGEE
jgi:hypothetical protein